MTYYIHIENDNIISSGEIPMGEGFTSIEVSEELYNSYIEDNDRYIYRDGAIIENPNYIEVKKQEAEAKWNSEFFSTSLGFIRRKVSIQMTGEVRDFLYDIKPTLKVGIPIITYEKPDFETSFEPIQNRGVLVTKQFLNECDAQIYKDFYGESPEA